MFPVGPSGTELLVVPVLTSELLLVLIVILVVWSPSSFLLGLWKALKGLLSGSLIETSVGTLIRPVFVSLWASWPWEGVRPCRGRPCGAWLLFIGKSSISGGMTGAVEVDGPRAG